MITLGLDPHPGTHTVVALDENGASLGHLAVPNTPEGLIRLHEFGARFFSRRWAVEGAGNHFIAAFIAELLAGSESFFLSRRALQVNTGLAADARKAM